jgi:hypothetical protein
MAFGELYHQSMTKAQATLLQMKWKQQGDPPCEHLIQELSNAPSDFDDGHVLNAYHCRDCGELFVDRFKAKSFSNSPSIEPEFTNNKT